MSDLFDLTIIKNMIINVFFILNSYYNVDSYLDYQILETSGPNVRGHFVKDTFLHGYRKGDKKQNETRYRYLDSLIIMKDVNVY